MGIINTKYNVDLCIIGSAAGGLSCAVRAAELGVQNILILEKMNVVGGCSRRPRGLFAINSPLQEEMGLHYSADEVYADLMKVLNWNVDAKLVRKWINGAGENIRWLMEKGVKFHDVVRFSSHADDTRITHHRVEGNNGNYFTGLRIVEALQAKCDEYGIRIIKKTRAEHLIRNEEGKVCGVQALGPEGPVEVTAKAVLLATGSISNNEELVKRFYQAEEYGSDVKIMAKWPHNTGDGLIMAEEVGASTSRVSTLFIGPHNHVAGGSEITGTLMRRPHMTFINRAGERFVDESWTTESNFGWMMAVNIDRQPGKVIYALFDQACLEDMQSNREVLSFVDQPMFMGFGHETDWLDLIVPEINKEAEAGRAKICNNLEEVAEFIGCPLKRLEETIANYNKACESGYDPEFLKEPKYLKPVSTPPYYVMRGPSGIDTCIGGLLINNHQEVLDKEQYTIPGLYAAGVVTSGWLAGLYAFFGSEMSYTVFSGRNAAEEIAMYLGADPANGAHLRERSCDAVNEAASAQKKESTVYHCKMCGFEYDEKVGNVSLGIAPGTKYADIPDDFHCPICCVGKDCLVQD